VVILQTPHSSKLCLANDGVKVVSEFKSTYLLTGPYAFRPSTEEVLPVSKLWKDDCSAFIGGSVAFDARLRRFQWLNTVMREFP